MAIWAYKSPLIGSTLYLPISGGSWDIGVYYIPLVVFTIISEVNAVNLTDGLDGLAASVTAVYTFAMVAVFGALATQANVAGQLLFGANLTGMAVFAAAVTGACLGFCATISTPPRCSWRYGSLAWAARCRCCHCQPLLPAAADYGICFVATPYR